MTTRRRAALGAVLSCFMLAGMAAPATAATDQPISVSATLGDFCVSGTGPANARHIVALLTRQGTFRARFVVRSSRRGDWFGCFPLSLFGGINGGDQLRVRVDGQERVVPVPNLLPSINRVSDVIRGRVQPGQTVELMVVHSPNFKTTDVTFHSATGGPTGRYRLDVSDEVDLWGGDLVVASVSDGMDSFGALGFVPVVAIEFRSNKLLGATAPDTDLRFTLESAGGTLKAERGASSIILGIFIAELFDSKGNAAYPEPGDWLSSTLASDAVLEIPTSELRARAWNDQVWGRCMPNAQYLLQVGGRSVSGRTDATGSFSRDFAGKINIMRGDSISLSCRYPTGDLFVRTMVVYR